MRIVLIISNHYITGKNKYNPIKVMPTTANANFAIKILDGFIQLSQQVMV